MSGLLRPEHCSVHVHSTFCDGKDTPQELAEAALAAGVRYLGFSSHCHTIVPDYHEQELSRDMLDYRRTVTALQEEYEGRLEILLGLEVDALADITPDGFDYWIGSVHYLTYDGRFYPVDRVPEPYAAFQQEAFRGDAYAAAEFYFARVAEMARRKPTILGHIDLYKKLNRDGRFFDEEHPRYLAAAKDALHAADPAETLLEINTGAVSRGFREDPYPSLSLLKEWHDMGGEVILTGDVHQKKNLTAYYREAAELAKAAGFGRSMLLTRCGRESCEF